MPKHNRPSRLPRHRKIEALGGSTESRAVEFLTINWIFSAITTLVCELAATAATWYVQSHPKASRITLLSAVLMFAALTIGSLSLVLLAAVWKLRQVKPPLGLSVFAAVVGALPMVVLLIHKLLA